MRLTISILLLLTAFNLNVMAKGRNEDLLSRMTFGLEWGYVASIHTGYHYNFFAPEGYRVDYKDNEFRFRSNADMYVHVGYDFSTLWNLSVYLGYEGVSDIQKAVPVSFRMTRFHDADPMADRWFSFVDLGTGIGLKRPPQEILTGKLGGGYRLSLSRHAALDFILSAKMTYVHPQIVYDKTPIPMDKTNRNNAYVTALSLGMALTF